MVPFGFTITPPASPPAAAPYHSHFLAAAHTSRDRTSNDAILDMQRRVDTIAASPMAARYEPSSIRHQDDEHNDDPNEANWSTPPSYNLDRAAAIAHKIAQEEQALLTPAEVLQLGGNLGVPFEYELDHKAVRFAGLYLVNGPTEPKHVRYAMEVSVPELQLRTRCIQRFQSFYQLRKRLLSVTKRCRHNLNINTNQQRSNYYNGTSSSSTGSDSKLAKLVSTWDELPFAHAAARGCRDCRRVRRSLKTLPFPRRKLFSTSAADVELRSFELEGFLGVCTRLLVDWHGCERGKKLFAAVVGKFLGVNILQQLFPSRYGRGSGYSNILTDNLMDAGSVVRGVSGDGSEYAQSAATTGMSSRSESSYTTSTTTGGGGGGFHVGGAPSCRTLLSTFSSASSLSLHDEDGYQDV